MFSINTKDLDVYLKYATIMDNRNHGYLEVIEKNVYNDSYISYFDILFDTYKAKKLKNISSNLYNLTRQKLYSRFDICDTTYDFKTNKIYTVKKEKQSSNKIQVDALVSYIYKNTLDDIYTAICGKINNMIKYGSELEIRPYMINGNAQFVLKIKNLYSYKEITGYELKKMFINNNTIQKMVNDENTYMYKYCSFKKIIFEGNLTDTHFEYNAIKVCSTFEKFGFAFY